MAKEREPQAAYGRGLWVWALEGLGVAPSMICSDLASWKCEKVAVMITTRYSTTPRYSCAHTHPNDRGELPRDAKRMHLHAQREERGRAHVGGVRLHVLARARRVNAVADEAQRATGQQQQREKVGELQEELEPRRHGGRRRQRVRAVLVQVGLVLLRRQTLQSTPQLPRPTQVS